MIILFQAILNTHPYHIDSLLQLSEICKMGEDYQMAAELIGAWTIYASLCHFEPLFWQNSFVATYHEQIIFRSTAKKIKTKKILNGYIVITLTKMQWFLLTLQRKNAKDGN